MKICYVLVYAGLCTLMNMPEHVAYVLVTQPKHLWVREGETAQFSCLFDFSPPYCIWRLNGYGVSTNIEDYKTTNIDNTCHLIITKTLLKRDNGAWRCVAPRSLSQPGLESDEAKLTILVAPNPPKIYRNGGLVETVTAIERNDLSLECRTTSGHPHTNFTWYLDTSEPHEGQPSTYTLLKRHIDGDIHRLNDTTKLIDSFSNVTLKAEYWMNARKVYCFIHNGNNTQNTSVSLNVLYSTRNVKVSPKTSTFSTIEGAEVHFECQSNGNPPPVYEWMFRKNESEPQWTTISASPNVSFKAEIQNQGQYICLSGNQLTKLSSRTIHLQVNSPEAHTAVVLSATISFSLAIIISVLIVLILRRIRKRQLSQSYIVNDHRTDRKFMVEEQDSTMRALKEYRK